MPNNEMPMVAELEILLVMSFPNFLGKTPLTQSDDKDWPLRQRRQSEFFQEFVVLSGGGFDFFLKSDQFGVGCVQVNFLFGDGGADVTGDVQVVIILFDFRHFHAAGITRLFFAVAVSFDDFVEVFVEKNVLAFAFFKMFGGVDEEHVVGLFAFFEDENADRNSRRIKEVRRQADDGVDMSVFKKLGADALLCATPEKNAVRQDDRHDSVVFEKMKTVQEKGKVGGGFRSESMIFETHVLAQRLGGFPPITEWRISDNGIELRHFSGIGFAQEIPFVGQGIAVVDFKFRILHAVEQHVHARQIVGGDILFLSVNFADAVWPHLFADVDE